MEHGYFLQIKSNKKSSNIKDISFLKKNYRLKPLSKLSIAFSLLPDGLFGEDRILALVCDDKMFFEQNRVGFNFTFFT